MLREITDNLYAFLSVAVVAAAFCCAAFIPLGDEKETHDEAVELHVHYNEPTAQHVHAEEFCPVCSPVMWRFNTRMYRWGIYSPKQNQDF